MAKSKRGSSKPHNKKKGGRRVGAINKGAIMSDLMGLAGLAAGQIAATAIQRNMTSMNPKVVAGVQIAGGVLLKHHSKSQFVQALGWGIAGAGTIGLAHSAGVIHGIDNMCDTMFNRGGTSNQLAPGQQPYPGGYQQQPVFIPGRVGENDNMDGISNWEMMSGIQNEDIMSGADDNLHTEFESVTSLGM